MVYRGTARRKISRTRPSIVDEEQELRDRAKRQAADRALGQSSVQKVPAPMPTGATAPPPNAMKDGLVNTRPRATMPSKSPLMGMEGARAAGTGGPGITGPSLAAGIAPIEGAAEAASRAGFAAPVRVKVTSFTPDILGEPTTSGDDNTTAAIEASDAWRRGEGRGASSRFDATGTTVEGLGGGLIPEDPKTFREQLEETLMGKLGETAEERGRREAGRAIAAARAQAGRGQMGMSGGMLALQSDVVSQATADAEDRLFQQQLGAGRIGTQLEALDKAEKLGILDYMENADFESQAQAEKFLKDYLGMGDEAVGAAIAASGLEGVVAPQDNRSVAATFSEEYENPASVPEGYVRFYDDESHIYYRNNDTGDVVRTRKVGVRV